MNQLTTQPFDDDKLREECGVFGVFGHPDAAALTVLGLHALQHRGQEAAGIVSFDGTGFHAERHVGLVGDTFTDPSVVESLRGRPRHRPQPLFDPGGSIERNIQPLFAEFSGGGFAVAHNGNLTNALTLQDELQRRGSIFQSTSDTEVILAPHRHVEPDAARRPHRRCAAPDRGRLVAGLPVDQEDDRLPRRARRPPAGPRRPRRRYDPRLGDLRARHHRRALRPRRRARRDGHRHRGRDREPVSLRAGEEPLLHLRIRLFRPARLLGRGAQRLRDPQAHRRRARRARSRPTPISSCRCPIPARRRRSATRRPPACPSISASSATTMSAAPSSSRRTPSATWASASSTTPTATCSPASGWCWSTIRSCAARPRRRS